MALNQVYDPIRKRWVCATPEEIIRQKWLEVMIHHLRFPKNFLVVERAVKNLPHLKVNGSLHPETRIDLLAYAKSSSGRLFPLIILECKAIPLSEKTLKQVMGYHHFIQSAFVAIANEKEIQVGYHSKGGLNILSFLPDYEQLVKASLKSMVSPDHF